MCTGLGARWHCAKGFETGNTGTCAVFGQACDGLNTISQSEELLHLEIQGLVHAENIGAFASASATWKP